MEARGKDPVSALSSCPVLSPLTFWVPSPFPLQEAKWLVAQAYRRTETLLLGNRDKLSMVRPVHDPNRRGIVWPMPALASFPPNRLPSF